MSDLDDSQLDASQLDGDASFDGTHGAEFSNGEHGVDERAMAEMNNDDSEGEEDAGEYDEDIDAAQDEESGMMQDEESLDPDGGASHAAGSSYGDDRDDDDGDLYPSDRAAGDPSSIHAPAGAGSAANDAAERLAQLLAQEQGEDGEEDEEAYARSNRRSSATSSKHSSRDRFGHGEEKESHSSLPSRRHPSSHSMGDPLAPHDGRDEWAEHEDDEEFFDDDEPLSDFVDSDLGEDDPHAQYEDEDEVRTAEDVQRAREEREHLIEVNKIRQRQIAAILERERSGAGGGPGAKSGSRMGLSSEEKQSSLSTGGDPLGGVGPQSHPEQVRFEYVKQLDQLNALWDELESKREDAEEKIDRLTAKLDVQDEKCTELADSLKSFKREIAKEAKFSRTGKPIKLKRILALESAEDSRDREVARVRLRHINLLHELRTLEDAVRTKERLAEGLHLIDFEQLKIENQTLNEKIEERNDELHKLKKKTTTTVQVLTHIKEKLECVREENAHAEAELRAVTANVQSLRDTLTRTKHSRDQLRGENGVLKQKQGFIGSDLLVADFEERKGDIDLLRDEVERLKAKWRQLNGVAIKAAAVERAQGRVASPSSSQTQTMRAAHYATVRFGAGTMPANRR